MLKSVVQKYPELDVAALLRHTSSIAALAELTGLDRRLLHRRCHSGLSISEADQCATALKLHASQVWVCWFGLADMRRRELETARTLRYRRKPVPAAKNRERRAAYYAENGAYERARQRAYYEANRERLIEARRARYRAKKAAA